MLKVGLKVGFNEGMVKGMVEGMVKGSVKGMVKGMVTYMVKCMVKGRGRNTYGEGYVYNDWKKKVGGVVVGVGVAGREER